MTTTPRSPSQTPSLRSSALRLLARVVAVEPSEIAALLTSFAYFFAVLTAYYIIRPLRDEMGVMLGRDALTWLLVWVFAVMLAAVPLFGLIVSKVAVRLIVPAVYGFFIANLVGFWLLLESAGQTRWIAHTFFVWVSVFNLFVVSLFWSVMSDTWASGQAKRLYGFIAAGGSIGAITGPLIAQSLVARVGPNRLLLISAAFLGLALALSLAIRKLLGQHPAGTKEAAGHAPADGGILSGAMLVWRSPYLMSVAVWVFLANLIVTYFYLEQARILEATISERVERVQLLARIDLAVSLLTVVLQVFLAHRVMKHLGLGISIACVPAIAIAGFIALAIAPVLGVIVCIMVAERAFGFAFANPAARVLWTVVDREAKYKSQSFIDTVVFRGGDAASGWVFGALSKGLGLGGAAIACLTVPIAFGWLLLSLALARMHLARSGERDIGKT